MRPADRQVIGTVVRLQVQRSRLKPGVRGERRYTLDPLLEVDGLDVGPRGVTAVTAGGPVLDVHHADHPDSRNRWLLNGLSLMTSAHYEALRSRYGPHAVDGAAGESLLFETTGRWSLADLAGPLHLEAVDGSLLPLAGAMCIPPCVEFSRWMLGRTDLGTDEEVMTALDDLGDGARGFYVQVGGTGRIVRGARLLR